MLDAVVVLAEVASAVVVVGEGGVVNPARTGVQGMRV